MWEDINTLRGFLFDVPEPLAFLTLAVARDVLARHEQGRITDDDLEARTDALEVRDYVRPEPFHDDLLKQLVFELGTYTGSLLGFPFPKSE